MSPFKLNSLEYCPKEKYRKAGTCKEIFNISSIHGTASIWEVDSTEKGAGLFLENPASPFEDFDVKFAVGPVYNFRLR